MGIRAWFTPDVGYLIDSLYENDLIRYDKNKIERL
jgi:hypothetical protein